MIRFHNSIANRLDDVRSAIRRSSVFAILSAAVVGVAAARLPAAGKPAVAKRPAARVDQFGDPLPEGAIARLGSIRFRHDRLGINCVKYSPDGDLIASSGYDRTVRLWNPITGQLLNVLSGHRVTPTDLSFSSDGRLLASRDVHGSVFIWNVKTGSGRELRPNPLAIKALCFTGDNRTIALADTAKGLRLLDSRTGKTIRTIAFPGKSPGVACLDVIRSSRLVAAASGRKVALYSLKTNRWIDGWNTTADCQRIAFLAGGDHLAVKIRATIEIRNAHSGQLVKRLRATNFAISPDGEHIYSLESEALVQRDSDGNRRRLIFARSPIRDIESISISAQNDRVAIGAGVIQVHDIKTGNDLVPSSTFAIAQQIQFSADSEIVNTGHSFWDASTGELVAGGHIQLRLPRHARALTRIPYRGSFYSNGSAFITPTSQLRQLRIAGAALTLIDARNGEKIWSYKPELGENALVSYVQLSTNGRRILVCFSQFPRQKLVVVLNSDTGKAIRQLKDSRPCRMSPNGKLLFFALEVWNVDDGNARYRLKWPVHRPGMPQRPFLQTKYRFSEDGETLTVGNRADGVAAWDLSSGNLIFKRAQQSQRYAMKSDISPNGRFLAFADSSRAFRRDPRKAFPKSTITVVPLKGPATQSVTLTNHDYPCPTLLFSPDSRFIVAMNSMLQLWRIATRKRVLGAPKPVVSGTVPTIAAAFSPDSRFLASTTRNGELLLWNLQQKAIVRRLAIGSAPVSLLKFSPNGRRLVAVMKNGSALIWTTASLYGQ